MEQKLIFENWKCRCSSLGNIMTNLDGITTKQLEEITTLENEKRTGINVNGNKVSFTPNKAEKLKELIAKRDKPDELPAGAISWLEEEFRHKFWGRRRILQNKYLDKGLMCEEDALQLLSDVDGAFYYKNDEQLENDYLTGCPDNRQDKIRDTKANYDLESFDKADLTNLYAWQLKGYLYLDRQSLAELDYCLVNNPKSELDHAKKSIYFNMDMPSEENEDWIEAMAQVERNMIFDVAAWKKNYPDYDFYNQGLDFSIPKHLRVKKFEVTLEDGDIENIIRRVKLARYWLREKELETLIKIKQV